MNSTRDRSFQTVYDKITFIYLYYLLAVKLQYVDFVSEIINKIVCSKFSDRDILKNSGSI